MKKKSVISTKSIPSFIILLPVISLVTVTLFVLFMINSIKDELILSEKHESKIAYEAELQKELKHNVTHTLSKITTALNAEITEYQALLPKKLDNFLSHYDHDPKGLTFQLDQKLARFNEHHPFFSIRTLSNAHLSQILSPLQHKTYQKRDTLYYKKELLIDSNYTQTLHYLKRYKKYHFMISLNKERFIKDHAHLIAQKLLENKNDYFDLFYIQEDQTLKALSAGLKKGSAIDQTLQQQPDFVTKILKNKEHYHVEKISYNYQTGFTHGQLFEPLQWIIFSYLPINEKDLEISSNNSQKNLYFEKKSEELLVVIVVVATIVLLLSLIVAKIINTEFNKFRDRITEQNHALMDFNKSLTSKVNEKTLELQKSEERYRTIFEHSPDSVMLLEDNIISYCNNSTLKIFGVNHKASIINQPITALLPPKQPSDILSNKLFNDYLDITMALNHTRFEFLLQRENLSTFFADVWLQNIQLSDDKKVVYIVFRDIDFQKRAQDKIKEQHEELLLLNETLEEKVDTELKKNKEKEKLLIHQSRLAQMGEMISMIAHQWRQPLNAISTSSANLKLLMELDKYEKNKFSETLGQIDDYIQHLSQTIDDFRNFFKPDKQQETTTIGEIIHKSLNIIEKSFQGNEISLDIDINEDATLSTYPHELMQVILNILKNAEDILLERHIKNKNISIRHEIIHEGHLLTFEDNAGGIPEEIIEKIFDPYFSTKDQKNGTGLGLYMSKVIINEHCKGFIDVQNREKGAAFIIKLPRAS